MLDLPRDHTPSAVFYRTTRVYGAFTDLLVLRGRTDYFDSILDRCFRLSVLATLRMDSQSDANKQTDPVVSPLLLRYSIVVHHRSSSSLVFTMIYCKSI